MRAMWQGIVIAESDHTIVIEGNHYFRGRARIRVKLGHSVLQLCDTATKSCSRLVLVTIVR